MTVETMKNYLRIDIDDDDTLIQSLITAAASLIYGTTGKTKATVAGEEVDISEDDLYNTALKMMVSHWYEYRGTVTQGQVTKIPDTAEMIINHIALCGDYT